MVGGTGCRYVMGEVNTTIKHYILYSRILCDYDLYVYRPVPYVLYVAHGPAGLIRTQQQQQQPSIRSGALFRAAGRLRTGFRFARAQPFVHHAMCEWR